MEYLDGLKVLLIHHKTDREVFSFSKPSCAYHDLTIALEGRMRYTIEDEHITLGEGDAIYCPPRGKISREKESKASYFSINFTTKTNEPLPLNHGMTQLLSHEVNAYIDIISYLLKKPGLHSNEKVENLVKNLLIKVIELQEVNRPMPYVEKIKLYCADNFQKPLTLETVAKYVNLHPSYCSTIFKRSEGKSVTEHINLLRINHAKELLDTTSLRVGEVGVRCGIPDPYYFSRVFNKICGISPSEYRRLTRTYGGGMHLAYTEKRNKNN